MKKNLLILMFFAFVVQAKAAILVEPYVGYAVGGNVESGSTDEDYTGTTIGGRLGWQQLGLFAGVDYRLSTFDIDGDDFEESQYGVMVGYDFPILVRVWGEYILGGEGDYDVSGTPDFKDPNGTILGVGFSGLPFVSLNLEMANYTYEDVGNTEADFQHYLVSVSLPVTF